MKIVNNSPEFKLTYDNKEYTITEGAMEITNDALGHFILAKTKQWGKKVIKTGDSKKTFIEPIITEDIVVERDIVGENPKEVIEIKENSKKSLKTEDSKKEQKKDKKKK